MNDQGQANGRDLESEVRASTANHFSISDFGPDVPGLLRRVADTLEQLGRIDVLDITFKEEIDNGTFFATMTVYLGFLGDGDLSSGDVNAF